MSDGKILDAYTYYVEVHVSTNNTIFSSAVDVFDFCG